LLKIAIEIIEIELDAKKKLAYHFVILERVIHQN
jgi:hypothetical protein